MSAGGLGTWCCRQAARCACGAEGSFGQRPNVPEAGEIIAKKIEIIDGNC